MFDKENFNHNNGYSNNLVASINNSNNIQETQNQQQTKQLIPKTITVKFFRQQLKYFELIKQYFKKTALHESLKSLSAQVRMMEEVIVIFI